MNVNSFFEVDGVQFADGISLYSGVAPPDVEAPPNVFYIQSNGDIWTNTAQGINWIKMYSGGVATIITDNYVVSGPTDIICANTYPITITLIMPPIRGNINIKMTSNKRVTIVAPGSAIDDMPSKILRYKHTSITLISNAAGYYII